MSENKKTFATPNVRKFARELGANINEIKGTERKGRITQEDVKNFVNNRLNKDNQLKNSTIEFSHSDFGETEIKEIPRVKKLAATHLVNSWQTIPHVTHHDEADVTELEEFRASLTDINTGEKIKISPLVFIIKSLLVALKKYPNFNSSIDKINEGKIVGVLKNSLKDAILDGKIKNDKSDSIKFLEKEAKKIKL